MVDEPLWRPSAARIEAAAVTHFRTGVAARRGLSLPDYASLHRWSVEDPGAFWTDLAAFAGVVADWGGGPPLEHPNRIPGARWFPTARLNFAENLLLRRDAQPALISINERGMRRQISHATLHDEVARVAAGLRDCGVVAGDRVAGFVPNLPEAVVAMLATASLGAVWSSCSPDFGISGVLDRFGQIAPKVLFTADGYLYAGKTLDSLAPISRVLEQLPSVVKVIVIPYAGVTTQPPRDAVFFRDFGTAGAALEFIRLPFDHPLYILYSSGTTGTPKCIVHGAGGTLLQHRKEHLLHTDLRRDDRLFYFTTCGWMMWNWLVSGLACGATLVLYDGSPFHPDPGVLWRMAAAEGVAVFGTSGPVSREPAEGGLPAARAGRAAGCAPCSPPARRSRPRASSSPIAR